MGCALTSSPQAKLKPSGRGVDQPCPGTSSFTLPCVPLQSVLPQLKASRSTRTFEIPWGISTVWLLPSGGVMPQFIDGENPKSVATWSKHSIQLLSSPPTVKVIALPSLGTGGSPPLPLSGLT